MVEDALCIGSLAVNVTFIVSPDFASVAFELLEDISNCCFVGDVLSTRTFDEVRSDCVSVRELHNDHILAFQMWQIQYQS